MDGITIRLNVDKSKLRSIGVFPDTSEGKAQIKSLLLECVKIGKMAMRPRDEDIMNLFLEEV